MVGFYAQTLPKDRDGFEYLKGRNLADATMLDIFQVGYCNGTLHTALPKAGELVDGLKALGVLNGRGQEHFRGCVTVPIFDAAGNVAGIYGRRITPRRAAAPVPAGRTSRRVERRERQDQSNACSSPRRFWTA